MNLFLLCFALENVFGFAQKVTKSVLITAEDEKLRDPEGYAAIVQLHHQMDDDRSGSIDRYESTDFLKEDMQLGGSDRTRREKAFHHNKDELITVDDLWEAWFASAERSWTTSEVVSWLENTVRLPQYVNLLIGMEIDGRALPRMAVLNSSYLSDLGIKNPVHKQKIRLKALDVVLFGFSGNETSRVKDVALSVLLALLVIVLFVFKRQRVRSRKQMEQLASKLSQLKTMRNHFEDVQQKFEEEQKKRHAGGDKDNSEQVATLRSQLMEAERLLESSSIVPLALQPLLRRTCELEMSYVGQQRLECIAEMKEAIEHIDKLRKKQLSIVSSIKLATGASSGADHIDSRIFALKSRMEKIALAMTECQQRWVEIESLCGFPLMASSSGTGYSGEVSFPSQNASGTLPRSGSVCSFCRSTDAPGCSSTSSIASSNQTGSSTTILGRLECICPHENYNMARHLTTNLAYMQQRIPSEESVTRIFDSQDSLYRSGSRTSRKEFCQSRVPAIAAAAVNSIANADTDTASSVTSEPAPDAAVSRECISPLDYNMSGLRRSASGAAFGQMSGEIKEIRNGLIKKGTETSENLSRQRKNKIPGFLRRLKL